MGLEVADIARRIVIVTAPATDVDTGLDQVKLTLNGQSKAGKPSLGEFISKGPVQNSTLTLEHGAGTVEVAAMKFNAKIITSEDIRSFNVTGVPKTVVNDTIEHLAQAGLGVIALARDELLKERPAFMPSAPRFMVKSGLRFCTSLAA